MKDETNPYESYPSYRSYPNQTPNPNPQTLVTISYAGRGLRVT
jgi:hypothetical protein